MPTSADIKKDAVLNYNGQLYVVTDFTFVNPGKGSAFYRTNESPGKRKGDGSHFQIWRSC